MDFFYSIILAEADLKAEVLNLSGRGFWSHAF
jgi:hypothetical protein